MRTNHYMNRAYSIEKAVNNKLTELESLKAIATRVTSTFSPVPPSGTRNTHRQEDILVKIIDLQNEISDDIVLLLAVKREIIDLLKKVDNINYRIILEERYLCYKTWEEIAIHLNYSVQHIYRLHNEALKVIEKIKDESK